jgi:hypothetical protein
MRSLLAGVCALSLASTAFAQQTVVGGPGAPPASGGSGSPGGSSGQIQFNNSSAFGGISTLTNSGGVITNSASTTGAAEQLTGTYTASTSSSMFYIDPAATASSTFSANGTLLGINAVSGYTGDLINAQLNGVSKFIVAASNGSVTGQGNATFNSGFLTFGSTFSRVSQVLVGAVPTSITTAQGMGTTPAILGSSSMAFQATVGASPTAGTFTINFPNAATRGYACTASDTTTLTNVISQTSFSTTTAVMQNYVRTTGLAGALTASDVIVFQCSGF